MLSSLANRLYWLGRNLERAESTARLINVYDNLLLDLPGDLGVGWETLVRITGAEQEFSQSQQWGLANAVIRYLAADSGNPNSICNCIALARENVRTLREVMPREGFECINDLHLFAQNKIGKQSRLRVRFATLKEVVQRCQQIAGLFDGTMSRGYAYEFLRLGRNVERADMTTRVLDVAGEVLDLNDEKISDHQTLVWISVLRCSSGYQMYRQSVRSRVSPVRVIHFLLNDLAFPRSVRFCLHEVVRSAQVLPHGDRAKVAVEVLLDRMDAIPLKDLVNKDLHGNLDEFQKALICVHDAISGIWFEH